MNKTLNDLEKVICEMDNITQDRIRQCDMASEWVPDSLMRMFEMDKEKIHEAYDLIQKIKKENEASSTHDKTE